MKASLCGLLVFLSLPAFSDMVSVRNGRKNAGTWFGKIVALSGSELILRARFRSIAGEKEMIFERSSLEKIEFDNSLINDGPPPLSFGVQGTSREIKPTGKSDQIQLINRELKRCYVQRIDSKDVKCPDSSVPRGDVLRILFEP